MASKQKRVFTVLCIDGGGIRGIVPARILQEIEERTGKPIAELFDLIGGASRGAIVASGLVCPDKLEPNKPRYSAQEMKNFYYQHGGKVFPEMRFKMVRKLSTGALYDPQPLEDALDQTMGDVKMKDALTSFMIPATDIKNFKPVWIANYKGQKDTSAEGWSTMKICDAVRAGTTVPTYFPAKYYETTPNEDMPDVKHRHALIDGGFFAGNALRRLLTQARKLAPPDAEIVIVHVGTGTVDHTISPEEFNKMGPVGLVTRDNGSLLMHLIVNMSAMDVNEDVGDEIGAHYINFDGNIDPAVDPDSPSQSLDDASDKNLQLLEKFAERIMSQHEDKMDYLCDTLKNRTIAEVNHRESLKAMTVLAEKLEEPKTVKNLTALYRKILNFASGIMPRTMQEGDEELHTLASKLTDQHKGELDRVYNVIQDKLENQNKVLNQIKQTGNDITKFVKNFGKPATPEKKNGPEQKPPAEKKPGNDNKPRAPEQKRKYKPKWW